MNRVAAGLGPDIDDRISDPFGDPEEKLFGSGDAHRERVDQDVSVVARVELDFAAHGRDTDAVAVAADSGDDTLEQVRGLGMVGSTEP